MIRRGRSLLLITMALGTALAVPARAEQGAELPITEATIPDTLHPNDFALIPADRAIIARVRATLIADPFLPIDGDAIAIQARHGKIILRGFIRSPSLKQEIDMRVPLIPGVEDLDNELIVHE